MPLNLTPKISDFIVFVPNFVIERVHPASECYALSADDYAVKIPSMFCIYDIACEYVFRNVRTVEYRNIRVGGAPCSIAECRVAIGQKQLNFWCAWTSERLATQD